MDDLDDVRLTLVGLFVESYKGLVGVLERRLAHETGLSLQSFELLVRLARSPGRRLRMTDLAAQTGLTRSGLTRAVDRLMTAGLAERRTGADDRRVAYAVLTASGLDRVRAALGPHVTHVAEQVGVALTPAEQDDLAVLLRKLRDCVNPAATTVTRPRPTAAGGAGARRPDTAG